ncbi:MAG: matrixin family metalloprotease [Myxococcales bacterium]|nr:matrixin family metalloprotease [Myxococcales bacterium]
MRRSNSAVGCVVVIASLLSAGRAEAWCRTTTNRDFIASVDQPCDTDGRVLYWASRCVGYSVQRDASSQVDLDTARKLAARAFDEWTSLDCPADPIACGGPSVGKPSMKVQDLGPVSCNCVEYNQKAGNANIIMFRDEGWIDCNGEPKKDADSVIALTTVTFSTDSGEIFDADIEINTANVQVTTSESAVVFDLWSVLTHETGHFLGLAHTQPSNTAATMYPRYEPGKTFMRDPSDDDRCAMCAAYPTGRSTICDTAPRRGLALDCEGRDPAAAKKGCQCSTPGAGEDGPTALVALGALALVGATRRRRHTLR